MMRSRKGADVDRVARPQLHPFPKGPPPMRRATLVTLAAVLAMLAAGCRDPRNPQGATAPAQTPRTDDEGVLLLGGLGLGESALAYQIRDAMGTRAEREARAPYSPPGWPLERDEIVTHERYQQLGGQFATDWPGVSAPFWVGTTVFGARWNSGGVPQGSGGFAALNVRYIGHFPQKTTSQLWTFYIPEHLYEEIRTTEGFIEVAKKVFRIRGGSLDGVEDMKLEWTRQAWLDGYTGQEEEDR